MLEAVGASDFTGWDVAQDRTISPDGTMHRMERFHGKIGRAQHGAISREDRQITGWDISGISRVANLTHVLHCFIFLILFGCLGFIYFFVSPFFFRTFFQKTQNRRQNNRQTHSWLPIANKNYVHQILFFSYVILLNLRSRTGRSGSRWTGRGRYKNESQNAARQKTQKHNNKTQCGWKKPCARIVEIGDSL